MCRFRRLRVRGGRLRGLRRRRAVDRDIREESSKIPLTPITAWQDMAWAGGWVGGCWSLTSWSQTHTHTVSQVLPTVFQRLPEAHHTYGKVHLKAHPRESDSIKSGLTLLLRPHPPPSLPPYAGHRPPNTPQRPGGLGCRS